MYDHFLYSEKLCKALKPFEYSENNNSFFRATEQTELHELNDNISSARGMIMISVDPSALMLSLGNSDSLMNRSSYHLIIVQQIVANDSQTILQAQSSTKKTALEVVSKILCDASKYVDGCEYIDTDSFSMEGVGPIGDNFYGVMLHYDAVSPEVYKLDKSLWNESYK